MTSIFSPKGLLLTTISTLIPALIPTIVRAELINLPLPSAIPQSSVGLEFEGSRSLNVGNLVETEYVGDCPGREVSTQTARFTSDSLPPGDSQRVVIKNMTRGMGETPYSDREYDKGRVSEGTSVKFGTSHDSQFFIVLPGENTFQYEVRRRDVPVATGTFTAMINQEVRRVDRNAQWFRSDVCANSAVSRDTCADMRSQQQLKCPNGKVLQTQWDGDYDRGIRTTFRNRTANALHFNLDGDRYVLRPGERMNVRRRHDFRVNFNPTCHTCVPSRDQRVTHGTRMQFQVKHGRLELTDDRWDY
jgi:hypothetical protein